MILLPGRQPVGYNGWGYVFVKETQPFALSDIIHQAFTLVNSRARQHAQLNPQVVVEVNHRTRSVVGVSRGVLGQFGCSIVTVFTQALYN
jgi:hypothetical protein